MSIPGVDFTQTKLAWARPISSYSKVQTVVGTVIRNRKLFANVKEPGCYVDLGCGINIHPDFCNVDYFWRPGVDICWDVTQPLPFNDGHAGGIFSEHMLEHLELNDALALLAECRRILCGGGILRVVVPDAELYLCEYAKHKNGELARLPYAKEDAEEFPIYTPLVSVNRIFRDRDPIYGHKFMWDYETLRVALIRSGFSQVERCSYGHGKASKLIRDSQGRSNESLYVEAI